jgi:hypothetical protein
MPTAYQLYLQNTVSDVAAHKKMMESAQAAACFTTDIPSQTGQQYELGRFITEPTFPNGLLLRSVTFTVFWVCDGPTGYPCRLLVGLNRYSPDTQVFEQIVIADLGSQIVPLNVLLCAAPVPSGLGPLNVVSGLATTFRVVTAALPAQRFQLNLQVRDERAAPSSHSKIALFVGNQTRLTATFDDPETYLAFI